VAAATRKYQIEEKRLRYLQKVNHSVSQQEIEDLRETFHRSLAGLGESELRLDGIRMILCSLFFLCFFFTGCGPREIKDKSEALRVTSRTPEIRDDLGVADFLQGLETHVAFMKGPELRRFPQLQFGQATISRESYSRALEQLLADVRADADPEARLKKALADNFDFMEVFGDPNWGDVFMTSYFCLLYTSPSPRDH
jgi:hypothetical protein